MHYNLPSYEFDCVFKWTKTRSVSKNGDEKLSLLLCKPNNLWWIKYEANMVAATFQLPSSLVTKWWESDRREKIPN